MSRPERNGGDGESRVAFPRYGGYVGLLALVILLLITINTITTKPNGVSGIAPGRPLAPFAAPLATGTLHGFTDVATGPNQGAAGRVPACQERGPRILNICQLYEQGPVVLALFVDAGSCAAILGDMQALSRAFTEVRFAAVAIKPSRSALSKELRRRAITFPVGVDEDGRLLAHYSDVSCPQVNFAYPGGTVQSKALLSRPSPATLRARVQQLLAASHARGFRAASG